MIPETIVPLPMEASYGFAGMPRLKIEINDELMSRIASAAELLWPGHGSRGIARFVRDAVRRFLRY